jgi:hypothetical protein
MPGLTGAATTIFASAEKPAPVHVEPSRPLVIVSDAGNEPPSASSSEPPKKKRGFWSRIFGGGKDRANNDKREQ